MLLVGTRKGAFFFRCEAGRDSWTLGDPVSFGNIVHHVVCDPRDRRTFLMAAKAGHLGPTVFRSSDAGATWKEAARPPAFAKAPEGEKGRVVDHVFWLTPGHASQPGVWYAGTSPQGLFRSEDNGETWDSVAGFHEDPMYSTWIGRPEDAPPDGARLHSILIDPRDPNHMYFGMSSGGVFETTNGGAKWAPLNKGSVIDFGPVTEPEFGQDPHCIRLHPLLPDRLYQQNHCGIYRMERAEGKWIRIGDNMPRQIRDIGFPMTLHPRDPDRAWVFPMDGTSVWPRTSPDGKPAVYVTTDAGASWIRQDRGLPPERAWLTVKRQAMTADQRDPVGLYFGTTSGEVWASRDEGNNWQCIASHLPHIYSTEFVEME
jgi:photosystem II stability/assembly factor-like uncharacterized protein